MKFEKVQDLIEYLQEFNPNARVLTDMGFSWEKPMGEVEEDTRKTTSILYVYGEYNPFYEDNQNFYRIKDFLINTYFDKYEDFVSCYLDFRDEYDEPAVEYYLKHKNFWSFDQCNIVTRDILEGLWNFCEENGYEEEFKTLSLFVVQEVFD